MARKKEQAPRSQRALTFGAVALLAVSAAAAFGRLFLGHRPTVLLMEAAMAAVALSAILQRRNVILSGIVSLACLITYIGVVLFPAISWHGLPTALTLRVIAGLARLIGPEARTQVAPTPALAALMLASIAAVWAAGFASHALLGRAGSPLLACLPPLALFTFADVVRDDGSRPGYALLVLAGVITVIFSDGLRRVRLWGPIRPWTGLSRHRRHITASTTRGARNIAALVMAVAAFVPGILPGWGSGPILRPHDIAGGGGAVNPFVSLQANLQRKPADDLFEVTAEQPAYWRMLSLDNFDGTSWSTANPTIEGGREVDSNGTLGTSASTSAFQATPTLHQEIQITGLRSPWLPMAWEPASISLPGQKIRYDGELAIAVGPDELPLGYSYSVDSRLSIPTPAELDAAPDITTAQTQALLPSGFYQRYVQLPETTTPVVSTTAERIARDEPDAYRTLIAIQDYLRTHYRYDETVTTPDGVNAVEWFLSQSKAGYCQQFSGAFAAMARSLGYPARVAVGFLPGYDSGIDRWRVTTAQAHAWPEVYFSGLGWIAFEPTPGRDNPVAQSYLAPPPYGSTSIGSTGQAGRSAGANARQGSNIKGLRWQSRHAAGPGFSGLVLPSPPRKGPLPRLLLLAGLLLMLVALSIPPAKALRRRHLLRSAKDPQSLVLASYRVFEETAADAGLGRGVGQTLSQYGSSLQQKVAFSDGHLERLLGAASEAAYSKHGSDPGGAEEVRLDAKLASKDVRASVPLKTRMRGWYRLRS